MVDEDRFVAAVRARAAAEPDKVYSPPMVMHIDDEGNEDEVEGTCVYVERDKDVARGGSCLFGCARIDAGVHPEALDVGEYGITAMVKESMLSLPKDVARWADVVQAKQDTGLPWGRAVEVADTKVGLSK